MRAVVVYMFGRNTVRLITAVTTTLKSVIASHSRRLSMSRASSGEKPLVNGFIILSVFGSRVLLDNSLNDDAIPWSEQNVLLKVPFEDCIVIDDILGHLLSCPAHHPDFIAVGERSEPAGSSK